MKANHKALVHSELLQCKETGSVFDRSHACYILMYWVNTALAYESTKRGKKCWYLCGEAQVIWLYQFITVIHEGTCQDWCLVVLDMVCKEYQEGGISW